MNTSYGVVIPAYNAGRTLGAAIESLLAQTVPATSILVVDDGSTDETAAIARSFGSKVELISQDNLGPAAATDAGFARLGTPLLAGLDADDIWFPGKAAYQLAELAADDELDGVLCRAVIFDHASEVTLDSPSQDLWGRSALMMRRRALDRVGPVGASTRHASGEMIDWLARGRELGLRFRMSAATLVGRRRIAGSMTDGQEAAALLPVVQAALGRKRGRIA